MSSFRPPRNARLIITLAVLAGLSITAIIGWATGFFHELATWVAERYQGFMAWVDSPMTSEHLMAGAAILLAPVIILVMLFALTDG